MCFENDELTREMISQQYPVLLSTFDERKPFYCKKLVLPLYARPHFSAFHPVTCKLHTILQRSAAVLPVGQAGNWKHAGELNLPSVTELERREAGSTPRPP